MIRALVHAQAVAFGVFRRDDRALEVLAVDADAQFQLVVPVPPGVARIYRVADAELGVGDCLDVLDRGGTGGGGARELAGLRVVVLDAVGAPDSDRDLDARDCIEDSHG